MTIDVQLVATDTDLENEVGNNEFCSLVDDSMDGRLARQNTLVDIIYKLRNRVPPIHENHLVDVTELQVPLIYGAIARLYRNNITTGDDDDVSSKKYDDYLKLYNDRVRDLRPSVSNLKTGGPSSIALHRR